MLLSGLVNRKSTAHPGKTWEGGSCKTLYEYEHKMQIENNFSKSNPWRMWQGIQTLPDYIHTVSKHCPCSLWSGKHRTQDHPSWASIWWPVTHTPPVMHVTPWGEWSHTKLLALSTFRSVQNNWLKSSWISPSKHINLKTASIVPVPKKKLWVWGSTTSIMLLHNHHRHLFQEADPFPDEILPSINTGPVSVHLSPQQVDTWGHDHSTPLCPDSVDNSF